MRRFLRVLGRALAVVTIVLVALLMLTVAPVDRTPVQETSQYADTWAELAQTPVLPAPADCVLRVGFARENITPKKSIPLAGYVNRRQALSTGVLDSLFVRAMVYQQGEQVAALISYDLLIVPPAVYQGLKGRLLAIGFPIHRVFLGATHTHSSMGAWDDHVVGERFAGAFDEEVIELLVAAAVRAVALAAEDLQPAEILHASVPVPALTVNRLVPGGPVDSLFHLVRVRQHQGRVALIGSYTAHATCLPSRDLQLSRDYPGIFVDEAERSGYDFALFLAGAVGSHAPAGPGEGAARARYLGEQLARAADSVRWELISRPALAAGRIHIAMPPRQLKILPDWCVRSWLADWALGVDEPTFSFLSFGSLVMVGTPCDFSGMLTPPLYAAAREHGTHLMMTSFNGAYVGYITPDVYFDYRGYETQTMNWHGTGNGAYFQTCTLRLLDRLQFHDVPH